MPDSLATSILTALSPTAADARRPPRCPVHRQPGLLVSCVGVHDLRDQPMPHHVGAGQLRDVNVIDTVEDVDRGPQPRPIAARQVDLRNIPGDNDLEPNPSRVRNIFICSAVVFWASSRMMNASLRVRPRIYASGATSITPKPSVLG